jgi:hypothetical protein
MEDRTIDRHASESLNYDTKIRTVHLLHYYSGPIVSTSLPNVPFDVALRAATSAGSRKPDLGYEMFGPSRTSLDYGLPIFTNLSRATFARHGLRRHMMWVREKSGRSDANS